MNKYIRQLFARILYNSTINIFVISVTIEPRISSTKKQRTPLSINQIVINFEKRSNAGATRTKCIWNLADNEIPSFNGGHNSFSRRFQSAPDADYNAKLCPIPPPSHSKQPEEGIGTSDFQLTKPSANISNNVLFLKPFYDPPDRTIYSNWLLALLRRSEIYLRLITPRNFYLALQCTPSFNFFIALIMTSFLTRF